MVTNELSNMPHRDQIGIIVVAKQKARADAVDATLARLSRRVADEHHCLSEIVGNPHLLILALQLRFPKVSESMGNHDSKIVDAGSVD
jgi:hypothetical protein